MAIPIVDQKKKIIWQTFSILLETTENAAYNHAEAAALKSPENTNSFDDNLIVIYNRVPKTGSTSFINLAYDLCKKNHFYVLHINITANMHVLSLNNQVSEQWFVSMFHLCFNVFALYMIIVGCINRNEIFTFLD